MNGQELGFQELLHSPDTATPPISVDQILFSSEAGALILGQEESKTLFLLLTLTTLLCSIQTMSWFGRRESSKDSLLWADTDTLRPPSVLIFWFLAVGSSIELLTRSSCWGTWTLLARKSDYNPLYIMLWYLSQIKIYQLSLISSSSRIIYLKLGRLSGLASQHFFINFAQGSGVLGVI